MEIQDRELKFYLIRVYWKELEKYISLNAWTQLKSSYKKLLLGVKKIFGPTHQLPLGYLLACQLNKC